MLIRRRKTLDPETRLVIANIVSPADAKAAGRHFKLRDGWEEMKLGVMETLVREKFKLHELRNMLVETHPSYLTEGNLWHDNFWGVCFCNRRCDSTDGLNHLGKILMKVRGDDCMTPEGQDLATVIASAKEYLAHGGFWNPEAMDHARVSQLIQDMLALLLTEAQRQASMPGENAKENADTRGADTQYGAPLATAAENQTVPAACASCGVSIHRYGVRLVRLGDGTWICADCFYQQRDVPKG